MGFLRRWGQFQSCLHRRECCCHKEVRGEFHLAMGPVNLRHLRTLVLATDGMWVREPELASDRAPHPHCCFHSMGSRHCKG